MARLTFNFATNLNLLLQSENHIDKDTFKIKYRAYKVKIITYNNDKPITVTITN